MFSICKPEKIAISILGKQPIKRNNYRPLFYTHMVNYNHGYIIANILTKEKIWISEDEKIFFAETKDINNDIVRDLIEKWFLVPTNFDDQSNVNNTIELKKLYLSAHKKDYLNNFVIFTTTDCNARCHYCYEKGSRRINMSEKTASDVAHFIIDKSKNNDISIEWFGGEPLYNFKAIDIICNILKEFGYNNLEDYNNDKKLFQLSQLNFTEVHTTSNVAFETIRNILIAEDPVLLFEKHETPFIYHGDEDYNIEGARASNITVYEGGYAGGTIVGDVGDLSIGIFLPIEIDLNSKFFLNKIAEILNKYNTPAVVDNNDIMVNNRKIIGTSTLSTDNYFGFVAYVSFSDKTELIKQVCGNNLKQPGFLINITVEELEEELRQWLV